jgi:hypothetical protein
MDETEAIKAVGCDPFSDDLKSKVQEALKVKIPRFLIPLYNFHVFLDFRHLKKP